MLRFAEVVTVSQITSCEMVAKRPGGGVAKRPKVRNVQVANRLGTKRPGSESSKVVAKTSRWQLAK